MTMIYLVIIDPLQFHHQDVPMLRHPRMGSEAAETRQTRDQRGWFRSQCHYLLAVWPRAGHFSYLLLRDSLIFKTGGGATAYTTERPGALVEQGGTSYSLRMEAPSSRSNWYQNRGPE